MSEGFESQVLSVLTELQGELGKLQTDVGGTRAGVGDLRTDLGGLRAEVSDLRTDLGGLRADVAGLKEEVGELRSNVADLQGNVGELQSRFGDLQEGFTQQRRVLDRVEGKVDRVAAELATMRPRVTLLESEKGHDGLRSAVLQERLDDHEIRLAMAERRLELRDE